MYHIKFKSFFAIAMMIVFTASCQEKANDRFSAAEKSAILDTIKSRMKVEVEDEVESDKMPTDVLFLSSAFLLDKATAEKNEKEGWVENKDGELEDLIQVEILDYSLKTEKNEAISLDKKQLSIMKSPFFDEGNKTYSYFSISIPTDKKYAKLTGKIKILLKIDDANKREIDLPVNLNIEDFFNK